MPAKKKSQPISVDEPLSSFEHQAVNYIEQMWSYYHRWPTEDELRRKYPRFNLLLALRKKDFNAALRNRGVPAFDRSRTSTDVGDLSNEQVAAVAAVTNLNDRRSQHTKLSDLGINPNKWQGWLKDPTFTTYLHKVGADSFQDDGIQHAHAGLVKAMDNGRTEAVKLYMEMTGRFTQTSPEVANLKLVIARLMEAIQLTIRDPDVLQELSTRFDVILSGGIPVDIPASHGREPIREIPASMEGL